MDLKFEHEVDSPKYRKILFEIILWVICLVLAIVLAKALVDRGLVKTTMHGDSMKNTLQNADKLIINNLFYRFTSPKRFDIIAYTRSGGEHDYLTVKRIIGLPGETIQIREGKIYIDDEELDEVVVVDPVLSGGLAEEPIALDENEYFLLGDNRNNSEDSRFANVGNIVRDDIVGKVWVRTNSFGFVHSLNIDKEEKRPEE